MSVLPPNRKRAPKSRNIRNHPVDLWRFNRGSHGEESGPRSPCQPLLGRWVCRCSPAGGIVVSIAFTSIVFSWDLCPLIPRSLSWMGHSTRSMSTECPSLNWWVSRASFAALSASHCSADTSAGGVSSSTTSVNPQPPQVTRNRAMSHTLRATNPYLTVRTLPPSRRRVSTRPS